MKRLTFCTLCVLLGWLAGIQDVLAQHPLYASHFSLQEVTLLDGPFKKAQDLNYRVLLEYDVNRLLTPFVRQAGLHTTTDENNRYFQWDYEHPNFPNYAWNPAMAMDGHIGGHYLSALSLAYASCHDEAIRAKLLERINYMVQVLKECQDVYDADDTGMKGFIGGIPDNEVWKNLYAGDYRVYNQRGNWVPYYCEHKIMAGLRDVYLYTGSEQAKEMFRKLCDWCIETVHLFQEDIMEMQILQWEHGSINEVFADAYAIFEDSKYLKAAQKFSHQIMIENMNSDPKQEFLDMKHANESTAKFVGFARIHELKKDNRYKKAAQKYWENVVTRRTMVTGGSGVAGYYQPVDKSARFISEPDGAETCNTYNMLKLTEYLFAEERNPRYAEYYERAMLNHILASQDPTTGGYVFYTSLRPESYRIYSRPNEAMWCCVGTGMESHSKYGNFIYTMADDTLFVNLFVASELNSEQVGLRQETSFPYNNKSRIIIQKSGKYTIAVRHPSWTGSTFDIKVNGKAPKGFKPQQITVGKASYIGVGKSWEVGDVIEITYPMMLSFELCPNLNNYIALKFGPVVLAAVTEKATGDNLNYQGFPNEYAGEGRYDHSPSTRLKFRSLAYAPMLICDMPEVPRRVKLIDGNTLTFDLDVTSDGSQWQHVEFRPFFDVHHAKYTVYMNQQTRTAWLRNPLYKEELRIGALEKATFDKVKVGDEASEAAHGLNTSETASRGFMGTDPFRDAPPGQWFEYKLSCTEVPVGSTDSVTLMCKFSISDRGRSGAVAVNGTRVADVAIPNTRRGNAKDKFFEMPLNIPVTMLAGKTALTVRFESVNGSFFPRLYELRLMRNDKSLQSY